MSGKLVLLLCALAVLVLAVVIGPGYFLCGLTQGCPGSQGRSFLAYAFEPLLGYELGIEIAHLIDLTPFTLTLVVGVIAALLVKKRHENEDFMAALAAANKCDGCNVNFPKSDYLTKVEGKGFLCEKCLSL